MLLYKRRIYTWTEMLCFFLTSLVKGLSILFIFSKNQFLDLLILWIVLLVSVSFNSALILLISFLLLTLALSVVVPLGLAQVGLGCLFEICLSYLGRPISLWASLSGLPLLCPIGFELLCVHFHLFPDIFLYLLRSHCWPIHYLIRRYSVSMYLNVFEYFPQGWFLVSIHCDPSACLIWFQFSWVCWGLFCDLPCALSFFFQ